MKHLTFIAVVCCMILTTYSCGNKTQRVPFDDGDSANVSNIDPTVFGVCAVGTTMNTLQLITDMGDTLSLDLTDAREAEHVLGGLQTGDIMAVIPNADTTRAVMVINQSALLGNWVMPNPIDGSDEIGISIKEGGIAESIDQSNIVYKTWRLVKGQLEIMLIREGGSELEETYLYDIVKLGPDELVYKDEEDTYEYTRQKPKETYGTEIVFDDDDDFIM